MKLSNFKLKKDRGVAGTTVLLGLIVSLFVIGLLVMIFALMGGELQTASYGTSTTTVTNESDLNALNVFANTTGKQVASTGFQATGYTLTAAYNRSANISDGVYNVSIPLGNLSLTTAGVLTNGTVVPLSAYANISISYTYSISVQNDATNVIGNTTSALSSVTDFFSLFIVIGSMVVLILLTVIIIVAIRQSGLLEGGTA
jgi:hypothetical protein